MTIFKQQNERGQAMVETVVVMSVLMTAVIGLMAVVSLQRRIYLENVATESLNLTVLTFTDAERAASDWKDRQVDVTRQSQVTVDNLLNTPAERFDSKVQKGLHVEVSARTLQKEDCKDEAAVRQMGRQADEIQFSLNGCSKERGWLIPVKNRFLKKSSQPFTILEDPAYNLVSESLTTKSLFVGKNDFAFSRRANEPRRSYRLVTDDFKTRYAMSGAAQSERNLNRDCFFNPFTKVTECKKKPSFGAVYLILGRISGFWTGEWMAACAAELAAKYQEFSILSDAYAAITWTAGVKSHLCTTTEAKIEAVDQAARALIKTAHGAVDLYEDAVLQALEAQTDL